MEPDAFYDLTEAIQDAMGKEGEVCVLKFLKSFVDNFGGMKITDMCVIHWKIGNATGHGQPIDLDVATGMIDRLSKVYGPGTHWIVFDGGKQS